MGTIVRITLGIALLLLGAFTIASVAESRVYPTNLTKPVMDPLILPSYFGLILVLLSPVVLLLPIKNWKAVSLWRIEVGAFFIFLAVATALWIVYMVIAQSPPLYSCYLQNQKSDGTCEPYSWGVGKTGALPSAGN